MQVCQVSASSSLRFLRRKNLIFFFKFTLCVAPQPIKLSDLDKSGIKRGGLLNKHFCKKKIQIFQMTWQILSISTFPIMSLWKLFKSCHSNQSSYLTEIKNITFVEGNVLSKYAKLRLHPPYGF